MMCTSHHLINNSDLLIVLCCWGDFVLGVGCSIAEDRSIDGFGVSAVRSIPAVVTLKPWQFAGHGGEQVVEGPGNDDIVVEADIQGYDDNCVAHTLNIELLVSKLNKVIISPLFKRPVSFGCWRKHQPRSNLFIEQGFRYDNNHS